MARTSRNDVEIAEGHRVGHVVAQPRELEHVRTPPPRLAMGTERNLAIQAAQAQTWPRTALRQDDVAQIVHDLKNPLATIGLEVELLAEHLGRLGAAAPPASSALDRITHTLAALTDMVHDILDLAAIEAGRFTIHRLPSELRSSIEDVIARTATDHDLPRIQVDARQPTIANVDDARLQRVIATLVRNALATSPHGAAVVIRLDVTAATAVISVIDAGPGMSAAQVATVFDPHRRTGLALHVSKRIIEAHGGRLGVETVPGTGSRFFLELPLARS